MRRRSFAKRRVVSEALRVYSSSGPGVTPEALARIGERFYRPPGQTATGSGLGLSIVQRIAKLHGMNVEFGNAEQGGFEAKVSW